MSIRDHPFVASLAIGSFGGVVLQVVIMWVNEPPRPSELWAIPIIIIGYGVLATPFVAIGLAVFGLLPTRALKAHAHRWWTGPVAVAYGYGSAKLLWWGVDQLMFFQQYRPADFTLRDPAIFYGVPTALAWWWFNRAVPQPHPKSFPPYRFH